MILFLLCNNLNVSISWSQHDSDHWQLSSAHNYPGLSHLWPLHTFRAATCPLVTPTLSQGLIMWPMVSAIMRMVTNTNHNPEGWESPSHDIISSDIDVAPLGPHKTCQSGHRRPLWLSDMWSYMCHESAPCVGTCQGLMSSLMSLNPIMMVIRVTQ